MHWISHLISVIQVLLKLQEMNFSESVEEIIALLRSMSRGRTSTNQTFFASEVGYMFSRAWRQLVAATRIYFEIWLMISLSKSISIDQWVYRALALVC